MPTVCWGKGVNDRLLHLLDAANVVGCLPTFACAMSQLRLEGRDVALWEEALAAYDTPGHYDFCCVVKNVLKRAVEGATYPLSLRVDGGQRLTWMINGNGEMFFSGCWLPRSFLSEQDTTLTANTIIARGHSTQVWFNSAYDAWQWAMRRAEEVNTCEVCKR